MADTSLDLQEQIARIDRMIAESQKFTEETRKYTAEQHKLTAEALKFFTEQNKLNAEALKFSTEQNKLNAEARKLDRERWLAPVLAVVTMFGALIAAIGGITSLLALLLSTRPS